MKVLLIQPPEWNSLWMPYSSLPALTASLRSADFETIQCDWNIEIHEQLLVKEKLLELWETTSWEEDKKASYPGVPGRAKVAARLKDRVEDVAESIEDTLNIFRDPRRFYILDEYAKAQETLTDALVLLASCGWDHENSLRSPDEALKGAMDESVNIYLPYLKERVEKALEDGPDLVGLSVTLPRQMLPAIAVGKLIKEARPEVHVTLGGAYPTMIARAIENSPGLFDVFDSVALSEGEVALLGLARAIDSGNAVSEVPGILFLENGAVKRSSLPVMVDADDLPTLDFDGLPLEKYLSPERILPAYSSRGCYWRRCTFCARPDRRGFSQRSPGQVIKDLTACTKKYKAKTFHFTDNTIRPRRMSAIADGIVEAGLEVAWTARTRFSPEITMEWCERVAAGGLVRIIFGVESASKRVTDLMQKGFRVEDVPKALLGLSKAGIDATLYLMVGFPSETKEEALKTLKFIEKLEDTLTPYAQYYVCPFAMPYSSPIYKDPEQFQVTSVPEFAPDDLRNPYCFEFETSSGMNRKEMEGAYMEFREKLAGLTKKPVSMPHDMLMRKIDTQETAATAQAPQVLKMNAIPKLADDLRAERGYLKKGDKKFRIDEDLSALIELLDSKKNVKDVLRGMARARRMTTANAFIFVQQLFEKGVITTREPGKKS